MRIFFWLPKQYLILTDIAERNFSTGCSRPTFRKHNSLTMFDIYVAILHLFKSRRHMRRVGLRYSYIYIQSEPRHYKKVSGQLYVPAAYSGNNLSKPLQRKMGGSQTLSEGKNLFSFSDIELRFRSCTACSIISTPIKSSGLLIHSYNSLSYERSKASSKASSPHSVI
jgi:hypothetical protein